MDQHHDDNYDEKIEKMLALTVSAVRGTTPLTHIAMTLGQIAKGALAPPEARELAHACSRILSGQRDPIALVENLPPELAEMVWEALEAIEAPPDEAENEGERQEISFEQLVEKVGEACTGNVALWQQLWDFTEELTTDKRLAPDIQVLGTVLRKILAGERQQHVLVDLSPDHRWAVEELLDWLLAQAVDPILPPAE